jgi:hypothetical protein
VAKQSHEPRPGRPTANAALISLKQEIAQRYEEAEREARKLAAAREREQARRRHHADLR